MLAPPSESPCFATDWPLPLCLPFPQAFTSASQGFLNCLVYGWTPLRRRGPAPSREADTQTPLLRAQKEKRRSSSSYQALSSTAA